MQDRFQDDTLDIFEEMEHFTPGKLTTEDQVPTESIANLCDFYDLDPQVVHIDMHIVPYKRLFLLMIWILVMEICINWR